MEESRGQVTGSAAEVYEKFFVPALFGQWCSRVAELAGVEAGDSVLDVACGTGALTLEMARRVGAKGVVGLDCNEGMLAVARELDPAITWQQGFAEELPFPDSSFDAVVSQFGLMFFEGRVEALREMWRTLAPGGTLVIAVWASLDATPGYSAMVELLRRLFGDEVASELRAPFCLGQAQVLYDLFSRAGVVGVDVAQHAGQARFPSIADWVRTDVRGWTLGDKIDDEQLRTLSQAARTSLTEFTTETGEVVFDSPALLARARKPGAA